MRTHVAWVVWPLVAVVAAGCELPPAPTDPVQSRPTFAAAADPLEGRIVFTANPTGTNGPGEIYAINPDGSAVVNLTQTTRDEALGVLQRKGDKILFVRGDLVLGSYDLWVMNHDGTNQVQLTNTPGVAELDPQWSESGGRIVYSWHDGTDFEIVTARADGSNPVVLTNNAVGDRQPDWSSDGKRIVFSRLVAGAGDVFVMNADGTGEINLTNHPAFDRHPTAARSCSSPIGQVVPTSMSCERMVAA
ncbi:MAG: TolB family protein [Gemmatimonadales bacterium]